MKFLLAALLFATPVFAGPQTVTPPVSHQELIDAAVLCNVHADRPDYGAMKESCDAINKRLRSMSPFNIYPPAPAVHDIINELGSKLK